MYWYRRNGHGWGDKPDLDTQNNVSEKRLHRSLAELDYHFNTRKEKDGERTVRAIRKSAGKRLVDRKCTD